MKMKRIPILLLAIVMAFSILPGIAFANVQELYVYPARILQVDSISTSRIALAGAEYEISDTNGKVIETVKTDATGAAQLSEKIKAGEYEIKVITPPAGYAKESEPYKVSVNENMLSNVKGVQTFSITIPVNAIHGSIAMFDESGESVAESGSIYSIYDASGKLFETVVTNSQGVAKIKKNVPYGTYTVKQTKAPAGYYLDRSAKTLVVSDSMLKKASNGTYEFAMESVQSEIYAKLIVIDAENKDQIKRGNMEFEVCNEEGELLYTLKTEPDGTVLFPEALPYGNYTIKPVKIAAGYLLNEKATVFSVKESDIEILEDPEDDGLEDGDHLFTYKFAATPVLSKIEVHVTGNVLKGFKAEDKNGYTVNVPEFESEVLEGVSFELTAVEDITLNYDKRADLGDVFGPETSNKKGIAAFEDLYLGLYELSLDSVPTGYFLDKDWHAEVETDDGNQKREVVKFTVDAEVELRKTLITVNAVGQVMESDGTSVSYPYAPLEGVTFGLFADEDFAVEGNDDLHTSGMMIDVATTDAEGKATFYATYPVGKYFVKQIDAPELYTAVEDVKAEINLADDKNDSEISIVVKVEDEFKNDIVKGVVTVTNKSSEDEVLTGASYIICDESGKQIAAGTIHAESHSEGEGTNDADLGAAGTGSSESSSTSELVPFSVELVPGKYTLKQTVAANGYSLDNEEYSFEINENGDPATFETVSAKAVYEFVNVDKDGKPQPGVEFTAYDKNGNEVAKAVSDENGVVRFEGFERGEYVIKQTSAADGYKISNEEINIEVSENWNNEEKNQNPAQFSGNKSKTLLYVILGCVGGVAVAGIVIASVMLAKGKKKKDEKKA